MELLDLAAVAARIELPIETVRSYGQRFALYVPAVREGARIWYTAEGATLLAEIHQGIESGATEDDIEAALQAHLPLTVVSSNDAASAAGETAAAITALRQAVDEQAETMRAELAALRAEVAKLATSDQFHTLRAETASLAAILTQRDTQLEHATAVLAAEVRELLSSLRDQVDALDAELQDDRVLWRGVLEIVLGSSYHQEGGADRQGDHPSEPTQRRSTRRTPRRLGQPQRSLSLPRS